jgi:hypothetical protein
VLDVPDRVGIDAERPDTGGHETLDEFGVERASPQMLVPVSCSRQVPITSSRIAAGGLSPCRSSTSVLICL